MHPQVATTVVVVQSDDLSAWIGLAGVAVGVILTAGIEWWRSRLTDRKETRSRLMRAGSDVQAAAAAFQKATSAAGSARNEAPWLELIHARGEAMHKALLTINLSGDKATQDAALQIVKTGLEPMPETGQAEIRQYLKEQAAALSAYRDAVRKARI
jgi:hypothetical protein